jgi:hypothetical protein
MSQSENGRQITVREHFHQKELGSVEECLRVNRVVVEFALGSPEILFMQRLPGNFAQFL